MSHRLSLAATAALIVVLVAGCSDSGTTNEGGPTPVASGSSTALQWGSKFHLPTEYAQWERAYQEGLEKYVIDHRALGFTDPPTDVSFVRFVTPDESAKVYSHCFGQQGFAVTVALDGGIEFGDIPSDQTPALLEADFRCRVQYPINPRYTAKLTDAQIRIIYDYLVNEQTPCLIREGYAVDKSKVPTWETFQASYDAVPGPWLPYDTVLKRQGELAAANGGVVPAEWQDEWERINKACPQNPPTDRLYPEDE